MQNMQPKEVIEKLEPVHRNYLDASAPGQALEIAINLLKQLPELPEGFRHTYEYRRAEDEWAACESGGAMYIRGRSVVFLWILEKVEEEKAELKFAKGELVFCYGGLGMIVRYEKTDHCYCVEGICGGKYLVRGKDIARPWIRDGRVFVKKPEE